MIEWVVAGTIYGAMKACALKDALVGEIEVAEGKQEQMDAIVFEYNQPTVDHDAYRDALEHTREAAKDRDRGWFHWRHL